MPLRYRVVGFVTYGDERGRRCPIPEGETVEVSVDPSGCGTMTWRDSSGRTWSEALSDRLLSHYTMSQLQPITPPDPVGGYRQWTARAPMTDNRYRRRV